VVSHCHCPSEVTFSQRCPDGQIWKHQVRCSVIAQYCNGAPPLVYHHQTRTMLYPSGRQRRPQADILSPSTKSSPPPTTRSARGPRNPHESARQDSLSPDSGRSSVHACTRVTCQPVRRSSRRAPYVRHSTTSLNSSRLGSSYQFEVHVFVAIIPPCRA
jgi:hypothetical protein